MTNTNQSRYWQCSSTAVLEVLAVLSCFKQASTACLLMCVEKKGDKKSTGSAEGTVEKCVLPSARGTGSAEKRVKDSQVLKQGEQRTRIAAKMIMRRRIGIAQRTNEGTYSW